MQRLLLSSKRCGRYSGHPRLSKTLASGSTPSSPLDCSWLRQSFWPPAASTPPGHPIHSAMANPAAARYLKIFSAFAGAEVTVVCGMVGGTVANAVARRDAAVLELIPVVALAGGLLALIPLAIAGVIYLIAQGLGIVTRPTVVITGLLLGAVSGFLIGNPPLTTWSGCLLGIAASFVWWRLYTKAPSTPAPSDTR